MINTLMTIQSVFKATLFSMLLLTSSYVWAERKLSVTLEQAAENVRKSEKGRILSAKTTYFNGQISHRIQVLTPSGRVKIVKVPTFKLKSNNYKNTNDYRNSNNQNDQQQNESTQKNKKPSRYQNSTIQRSRQVKPRPNYQRPTQPKPNTEKSGNKKQ